MSFKSPNESADTIELPVLQAVVRDGDPTVISRERLRLASSPTDSLLQTASPTFESPSGSLLRDTLREVIPDLEVGETQPVDADRSQRADESSTCLEDLIDEVIDRHVTALRRDIAMLLDQVRLERQER